MLSDIQVRSLAQRMDIPLAFCSFKSNLARETLEFGKGYVVNMQSTTDPETGKENEGSHYVCFQCNRYPSGEKQCIYFDSFGMPPPQEIIDFCAPVKVHWNTKDIQSLMADCCGYYCLAFLHFINACPHRSGHLFCDSEQFTDLFDDLNKEKSHLRNEYTLRHFFRSSDPAKRKDIEVGF